MNYKLLVLHASYLHRSMKVLHTAPSRVPCCVVGVLLWYAAVGSGVRCPPEQSGHGNLGVTHTTMNSALRL